MVQAERQSELDVVLETLRMRRGVYLWGYRAACVERYVHERVHSLKLASAEEYAGFIRRDDSECDTFLNSLLINESSFFREWLTFSVLFELILPCLFEDQQHRAKELRIWSAGCASGEEIYSIAILLTEFMRHSGREGRFLLFGSDISQRALDQAKRGRYPKESLRHVPFEYVESYFDKQEAFFVLSPAIRTMVHFSRDDILHDERVAPVESIFGSFDLIMCRNLLMYYDLDHQNIIASKLTDCLNRNGYLILGDSESISNSAMSNFVPVMGRRFILQKK